MCSVWRPVEGRSASYARIDYPRWEHSYRLAVEHLLSCGRTRIAHITGDPDYAAAQDRAVGVRAALAEAGLDLVGDTRFSTWSEQWGRDASAQLLAQHPDVDGIVCGSDQIARGVLDTLRDLGKDVPGDVAVIGYDNREVLAVNARPELTSIDANLQQLGRAAAMRIFEAIEGAEAEADTGVHHLPVRLVIRGSTIERR